MVDGVSVCRHVLSMVDDRPYKAGVVGSSPTVPTIIGVNRVSVFEVFAES